jgi:ribosomal protein S27AE
LTGRDILAGTEELLLVICGIVLLIFFLYMLAFLSFARKMKLLKKETPLVQPGKKDEAAKDMKQCPQCGKLVVDEYGFCPRCGTDLK